MMDDIFTTPAPTVAPTTAIPTTLTPTTVSPTTATPTTSSPTTASPTTTAPTTAAPTTVAPTTIAPTPHHRHHSKIQELEIDSSVVIGFVLVCVAALMYKKRRRLPFYWLKLRYYLCCGRLSERELVDQQEEYATLNDFIFEAEGPEDRARVLNVSGLTYDDETASRMPMSVVEVSIDSVFPDLLGQEMERQSQGGSQSQAATEPLLPQQQPPRRSNSS